jgi:hypothetical protein
MLAHDLLGLFHRHFGKVFERQPAERQRDAVRQSVSVDIDKLERPAAKIADNAIRLVEAGHDAERGEHRLLLAGEHIDVLAADLRRRRDELRTVVGIAARGSRDAPQPPHTGRVAERAEPAQRIERLGNRVRGQQAGGLHLAAKSREHLFVEDRRRRAGQPLVDDETDRVRADVDDGDRMTVVEPALRQILRSAMTYAHACA